MPCVIIFQTMNCSDKLSIDMPYTVINTSSAVFNLCHLKETCNFIDKRSFFTETWNILCSVSLQVNFVCSFVYVSRTISFTVIFLIKWISKLMKFWWKKPIGEENFQKGGNLGRNYVFLKSDEQFYSFFQQIQR